MIRRSAILAGIGILGAILAGAKFITIMTGPVFTNHIAYEHHLWASYTAGLAAFAGSVLAARNIRRYLRLRRRAQE
jgi:ABC-type antimicrobial peptide transport system permease subunit